MALNYASFIWSVADLLRGGFKAHQYGDIILGDTLIGDGYPDRRFNYCLSNPPFGVDWKRQRATVTKEHDLRGFAGRFGPGLPRVSDGAMLFLLHLISKLNSPRWDGSGGRGAIVLNGSPLFSGGAGSGESNIRRWVLDRDYLDTIIALPTDMFYNTGIATYIWLLDTDKPAPRRGQVRLIDATGRFEKTRKSLGSKRHQLGEADIAAVIGDHGAYEAGEHVKVLPREAFYYRTITVEQPLRDPTGAVVRDGKGKPKPDTKLRDTENLPWDEDIDAYLTREVQPFLPDAWVDQTKTKDGCEIPFTRYFYVYTPPRPSN